MLGREWDRKRRERERERALHNKLDKSIRHLRDSQVARKIDRKSKVVEHKWKQPNKSEIARYRRANGEKNDRSETWENAKKETSI